MRIFAFLTLAVLLIACEAPTPTEQQSTTTPTAPAPANLLLAEDLEWGDLNPARGASSPRAANLWGDRSTPGAAGFLVKFREGFSSPPHIHNVTYRALVLEGEVHNDDPDAART